MKAVTSGSSSVLVSWKSPNTPNGKITKYTVYRREVVNGAEVKRERERESENNTYKGTEKNSTVHNGIIDSCKTNCANC